MKTSSKIAAAILSLGLVASPASHAWFFLFLPLGLLAGNDKKTIDDLERKGDWPGMQSLAEKRLETDGKNASWLYLKGLALQKQGKQQDAIVEYQAAIDAKSGNFPGALMNIAACQVDLGQYDAAIETSRKHIALEPESWKPYNNAAIAAVKKEDIETAKFYWEKLNKYNFVVAENFNKTLIAPLEAKLARDKQEAAAKQEQERLAKEAQDRQAKEAELAKVAAVTPAPMIKSTAERLIELKQLYSQGLLTKEVYESSQRDILKSK